MQTSVIKPQRNELCQQPLSLENISKLQIRSHPNIRLDVSPRDPEISVEDPLCHSLTLDSCVFITLYFLLHYIASIFMINMYLYYFANRGQSSLNGMYPLVIRLYFLNSVVVLTSQSKGKFSISANE